VPKFEELYSSKKSDLYYTRPTVVLKENIEKIRVSNGIALDIGCGDGRNSFFLAEQGFKVKAFDISISGIEKINRIAKTKNLSIEAQCRDIRDLDFQESTFDLIVASTILDHLEEEEAVNLAGNIRHWLKPYGFLYAGVFTIDDPAYKLREKVLPQEDKDKVSETGSLIKRFFARSELRNLFSDFKEVYYCEGVEEDLSHGRPHFHGIARLLCQKLPQPLTDNAI
jgi:tellurite methyltransferase